MDLAVSSSIHLPSQTFDWFKEPELISFAHLSGGAGAVLGSEWVFWILLGSPHFLSNQNVVLCTSEPHIGDWEINIHAENPQPSVSI